MKIKPYFYEAPDGIHYPDAMAGARYYYGVNFDNFLDEQNGTLETIEWQLEVGLTKYEEFLYNGEPNIACINIESPYVGSYTVKCVMGYTSQGVTQSVSVPLIIKVY